MDPFSERKIVELEATCAILRDRVAQLEADFVAEQEAFAARSESIEFQARREALLEAAAYISANAEYDDRYSDDWVGNLRRMAKEVGDV